MTTAWKPVLDFWFGSEPLTPETVKPMVKRWFMGGPAMDRQIADRFAETVEQALAGRLDLWSDAPEGRLALILLLDQFCRNLFRATPQAFAGDSQALALTDAGLSQGLLSEFEPPQALFFLLPLMHAEDPQRQQQSVQQLHRLRSAAGPGWWSMLDNSLEEARRHQQMIDQFDRFPHRNAVLGRSSTPAELAYLERTGRHYGQAGG